MFAVLETLILARMGAGEPSLLVDAIESMLREPPVGGPVAVARLEETLTDGYACALEIEAERWRLERRIAELARRLARGEADGAAGELAGLSERLAAADDELGRLRRLLESLRRHAAAARAA